MREDLAGLARELGLVVEGDAPGGEFGAIFVRDRRDRPLVLKAVRGAHRAERWRRGATIAQRLKAVGYPAPGSAGTGVTGDVVWSLQERLPGIVPEPLREVHVAGLLELTELHADAAADLDPTGADEPQFERSLAGAERLRQHERTAPIGVAVERVLRRGKPATLRSTDICHGDFHHRNLLADGDNVTGVFDWEGAGRGDWRFDVATLAFWCTVAAHQTDGGSRAMARARAEEVCDPPLLAYFTAALAARLLSFSIQARPEHLDVVLPAIAQAVAPWWDGDVLVG